MGSISIDAMSLNAPPEVLVDRACPKALAILRDSIQTRCCWAGRAWVAAVLTLGARPS